MHALSGFRDSLIYPEEISRVVAQAYNLALRRQKMGGSQTGSQLGYVARSCEERKEGRLAWADRSVSRRVLCNPEDQSSLLGTSVKKQGMVAYACKTSARETPDTNADPWGLLAN